MVLLLDFDIDQIAVLNERRARLYGHGGLLKLTRPLPLRPGERVNLIVVRQPDRKRWDLERFRKTSTPEERELAEQGLADWLARLDKEDQ